MLCLCHSQKPFNECCQAYLEGRKNPLTPEALMRSRYSAFASKNIEYIGKTMKGDAMENFNPNDTLAWMDTVEWTGLTILEAKLHPNKSKGTVEFVATYEQDGEQHRLHEKSKFRKDKGVWYYIGGTHHKA